MFMALSKVDFISRCFYLNLPTGGASALIILLFFQTPPAAKPATASLREKILQMDPLGTTLLLGAIISYILALQYGGQTYSWDSSTVIGLLIGFVVLTVVFAIFEVWQGERSMLVPRILNSRVIGVGSAFQFFFAGSYYTVVSILMYSCTRNGHGGVFSVPDTQTLPSSF
jgi:hypothetical protein